LGEGHREPGETGTVERLPYADVKAAVGQRQLCILIALFGNFSGGKALSWVQRELRLDRVSLDG
jgi:hypothetical protein